MTSPTEDLKRLKMVRLAVNEACANAGAPVGHLRDAAVQAASAKIIALCGLREEIEDLRAALKSARGWVITCCSSATARRDLVVVDAALDKADAIIALPVLLVEGVGGSAQSQPGVSAVQLPASSPAPLSGEGATSGETGA